MLESVGGQRDLARVLVRPTGTTPTDNVRQNCSWK